MSTTRLKKLEAKAKEDLLNEFNAAKEAYYATAKPGEVDALLAVWAWIYGMSTTRPKRRVFTAAFAFRRRMPRELVAIYRRLLILDGQKALLDQHDKAASRVRDAKQEETEPREIRQ